MRAGRLFPGWNWAYRKRRREGSGEGRAGRPGLGGLCFPGNPDL